MFRTLKGIATSSRSKESSKDVGVQTSDGKDGTDNEQVPIPTLPDELMLMIFGELNMAERTPLGKVCKRFRELDFELGKKSFDTIYVNWTKKCHHLTGRFGDVDYNIYGGKIDGKTYPPLELTKHNLRIFRNAYTTALNIALACKIDKREALLISTILKSVTFDKLAVFFEAVNDYDEDVVPDLFKDRYLKHANVTLRWNKSVHHDGNRARALLMQLPRVYHLQIEFEYSDNKIKRLLHRKFHVFNEFAKVEGEYLLDDATLLHLTRNTHRAIIVGKGKCSAAGMLRAFEVIRRSRLEKKLVLFFTPRAEVEQLLHSTNHGLETDAWRRDRNLVDRTNRALMIFHDSPGAFYSVSMGKVDKDGLMVSWQR